MADAPPLLPLRTLGPRLMAWFLGDGPIADPEDGRRSRLIVASALALTVVEVLVLAVSDWGWQGSPPLPRAPILGVLFAIPVNLSIAVLVRRTANPDRAGLFLLSSLIIIISFIVVFGGGYHSPITWWLAVVPLFGAFLAGTRGAILSTVMVIAVLLALYGASPVDPSRLDPSDIGAEAQLRAQLALLALVTFIALYNDRMRTQRDADLVATFDDLDEAHRALRLSQLHLQQIAEGIGQAIWMDDQREGRVLYANTSFERVFGIPRNELRHDPRAWASLVPPEDRHLLPTNADGSDHVYRIEGPHAEPRWIRHAAWAVHDEDEQRIIHIAADITHRRQAEELRERFIESVMQAQETERQIGRAHV